MNAVLYIYKTIFLSLKTSLRNISMAICICIKTKHALGFKMVYECHTKPHLNC